MSTWTEIRDLLDQKHDFPETVLKPKQSFMVAATPRTGSSLLCLKLWETGQLGAPWEYFHFRFSWALIRRLDPATAVDYVEKVQRCRTSPNGVFGCKIFARAMLIIEKNFPEMFLSLIPDKIVYLYRDDISAQAHSLSRAMQTNSWFDGSPEWRKPSYNAPQFAWCVADIKAQNEAWKNLFDRFGVEVLEICYEDLIKNAERQVNRIGATLGIGRTERVLDVPIPAKQRSDHNDKIN